MNIFDIIGPVMVGPSSSHTAGAVRIGYISRKLMGEPVSKAQINLYGSFLATGKGHGTRKALVAGLLGMNTDDMRIPDSFEIAKEQGMEVHFGEARLKDAHPNTAQQCFGQRGKGVTLHIGRQAVAQNVVERPLGGRGELFRHNQQAALAVFGASAQLAQHPPRFSAAGRT